jgi:hypothetical protein
MPARTDRAIKADTMIFMALLLVARCEHPKAAASLRGLMHLALTIALLPAAQLATLRTRVFGASGNTSVSFLAPAACGRLWSRRFPRRSLGALSSTCRQALDAVEFTYELD